MTYTEVPGNEVFLGWILTNGELEVGYHLTKNSARSLQTADAGEGVGKRASSRTICAKVN